MKTQQLNTLNINKLSDEQFRRAVDNNKVNETDIYLTPDHSVEYVEQHLTEEQQAQARANIAAIGMNTLVAMFPTGETNPYRVYGTDKDGIHTTYRASYELEYPNDLAYHEGAIPLRQRNQIVVGEVPALPNHAASKHYVDSCSTKLTIHRVTSDTYEQSFRFGDHLRELTPEEQTEASSFSNSIYGILPITVPQNAAVEISFQLNGSPHNCGIDYLTNKDSYEATMPNVSQPFSCESIRVRVPETALSEDASILGYLPYCGAGVNPAWQEVNSTIAFNTGGNSTVKIYLIEENIPVADPAAFRAKYENVEILIHVSVSNEGSEHSTLLRSNTEVHYSNPVTELTITKLQRSFSVDTAQEWSIAFQVGEETPSITIPTTVELENQDGTSVETFPLKWLYAQPIFEVNRKYLITFKQILDTIYGVWTVLE